MPEDDTFIGQSIGVLAKSPAEGGMLENVYLRRLEDRLFIVGQLADYDGSDARAGLTFWFAFDEVVMLTEHRDVESARKIHAARRARRARKRSFWGRLTSR